MDKYFYYFFHKWTNDRDNNLVFVPKDRSIWPESWNTVEKKSYSILESIKLQESDGPFLDFLKQRVSGRKELETNVLNISNISYVLKCAYGEIVDKNKRIHRTVPSGGSRYSLEIYLLLFKSVDGLLPGVYHYNVERHELEPVKYKDFNESEIKQFSGYDFVLGAHGIICVSSVFDRVTRKYGSMGYRLMLLEAGHVGQNIYLAGVEKKLLFCSLGWCNNSLLESELGINSISEGVVYTIAF